MKAFDADITSGSILRSVWKLAWPMTLLNLINGFHGQVDHFLVGHFVEVEANAGNAAIGGAWQLFLVVVVFISSLFQGMNVLIARYAGKQDRDTLSRVAYSIFLASVLILVFVVSPAGYLLAPALLRFINARDAVATLALPYLRILFVFSAPLFLMFMLTAALQASGEPKTPLKLALLTMVLHILISTVLVAGLGPFPKLGTTGAAIGACTAPVVTVCVGLGLILRGKTIIQPPQRWTLLPDFGIIKTAARIGVPTGIQAVLLNIGGVILFRKIGSLPHSGAAQAAYAICYNQLFALVMWISFGLRVAASTIVGQNLGAGNPERAKTGAYIAAALGVAWAAAMALPYWFLPRVLLGIFNATEEPVLGYGIALLHVLGFSGILLVATLAFTGALQGAGETKKPMYIAFATQIVILLGLCEIFDRTGTLSTNKIWLAIFVSHFSRFVLTYAVFRRGHWTRTQIELSC
jgi:putative MATE family efflux protein